MSLFSKFGAIPLLFLVGAGPQSTSAQEVFESIRSVNFDVKYQKGVTEEEAREAADYLESDYEYLRKTVGIDLGRNLPVRIYGSTAKFNAGVKRRAADHGVLYERGTLHVQPIAGLTEANRLAEELSFGLALALLDRAGQHGCPRWLREAFAVYHCGKIANMRLPAEVRSSYLSDLDQDIQQYPDPPEREDIHYVLGSTVKYFVDTYGEDRTFSLYRLFDGTRNVEEVFREAFGEEYTAVEAGWARQIKSISPKPGKRGG